MFVFKQIREAARTWLVQTGRRKEKKKVKLFPGHHDRTDVSKEDGFDGIDELPATPGRPAKVIFELLPSIFQLGPCDAYN